MIQANQFLDQYLARSSGNNSPQGETDGMGAMADRMREFAKGYVPEDVRGRMVQNAQSRGEVAPMAPTAQQTNQPNRNGQQGGRSKAAEFLGGFISNVKAGMNPGKNRGMSQYMANDGDSRGQQQNGQRTQQRPMANNGGDRQYGRGSGSNAAPMMQPSLETMSAAFNQQGNKPQYGQRRGAQGMSREGISPMGGF